MADKKRATRASVTSYTLDSIKPQIIDPEAPTQSVFQDLFNQARAEEIELLARQQFLSLRGVWSFLLIGWITALLLFQIGLAISIGIGWLNFKEYKWFLPLVVAQNFGQIIGMGIVIVRFLYPPSKVK